MTDRVNRASKPNADGSLVKMAERLEQLSDLLDALEGPLEMLGSSRASAATTPQHSKHAQNCSHNGNGLYSTSLTLTPTQHTAPLQQSKLRTRAPGPAGDRSDPSSEESERAVTFHAQMQGKDVNSNGITPLQPGGGGRVDRARENASKGAQNVAGQVRNWKGHSDEPRGQIGSTAATCTVAQNVSRSQTNGMSRKNAQDGRDVQQNGRLLRPMNGGSTTQGNPSESTAAKKPAAAGVFRCLYEEVLVDEVQACSIVSDAGDHAGSRDATSAFSSFSRVDHGDDLLRVPSSSSMGDLHSMTSHGLTPDIKPVARHLLSPPTLESQAAARREDRRERSRSSSPDARAVDGHVTPPPPLRRQPSKLRMHDDFFVEDFECLFSNTPPADPALRLQLGTSLEPITSYGRRALHTPDLSDEPAAHEPQGRRSREVIRFADIDEECVATDDATRPLPAMLQLSQPGPGGRAPAGSTYDSGAYPESDLLPRLGSSTHHLQQTPDVGHALPLRGPRVPWHLGAIGGARTLPPSLQPTSGGGLLKPLSATLGPSVSPGMGPRLGSARPGVLCDGRSDAEWLGGDEMLASWGVHSGGEDGDRQNGMGAGDRQNGMGVGERLNGMGVGERLNGMGAGERAHVVGERSKAVDEFREWDGRLRRVSMEDQVSVEGDGCMLKLEWHELATQTRGFVEETGGGSGTWIDNGRCFGLGVERDLEGEREERAAGKLTDRQRIVLRPGFAEGRDGRAGFAEWQEARGKNPRKMRFEKFVARPPGSVAFGRIGWTRERDPVSFVRCSTKWNASILPDLVRFFVEHVWGLVRPNLLISLIGCQSELDIRLDQRVKIAQIMDVALETGAWVVTGGLDSGVSRLVADARSEVENQVPLIGFVPWGLVEGRQALWESEGDWRVMSHTEKLPVDDFGAQEQLFRVAKPAGAPSVRLSRSHSHLILVDDGTTSTPGGEINLRAAFEAASCRVDESEQQGRILQALRHENIGWQLMRVRDDCKKPRKGARPVPSIALCVNGDHLSIKAVAESVKLGSPVLLARGSGGAADLLADAVQVGRGRRNRTMSMESDWSGGRRSTAVEVEEAWDAMSQCSASDDVGNAHFERRPSVLSATEEHDALDQSRLLLLSKLLHPSNSVVEQAGLAVHVERVYGIPRVKHFGEIAATVREIAESGLCHVFNLEKDEDIGGAMLAAILKKERDSGVEWKDCLDLIVSWNKVGIMKRTLDRLRKVTPRTRKAVEAGFHHAFVNNKTAIAQCLLEHLECTGAYNVSYNAVGEGGLFSSVLLSVKQQKKRTSRAVNLWGQLACAVLKHGYGFDGGLVWERWADLHERALLDEEARRLLETFPPPLPSAAENPTSTINSFHSRARRLSLNNGRRVSLSGGGLGSLTGSGVGQSMHMLRRTNSVLAKKIPTFSAGPTRELEHVYKSLLGTEFWYETSVKGAELDLFLWSLLMRRKGMTKMLWARLEMPVRASLLAAMLYRRWVKHMDLKMHVREALLKDADDYEEVAVKVQTLLMRCDANVALETLERPSDLWKGLTGIDLAVMGGNHLFIERCCAEAFDCRWTGDIHPYGQRFGLYPTVLLSVFSLGLLAPDLLVFRPPPRAEAIRQPTQRRQIPAGYHDKPRVFEERYRDLEAVQEGRTMLLKLQKVSNSSTTYMDQLEMEIHGKDAPGVGVKASWLERYRLFAQAPVTIFMVDALQQVAFNLLFTSLLISGGVTRTMCWKELVLCWSVLSISVYEGLQLVLEGYTVYLANSWNWFRALSCVLFWLGLTSKLASRLEGRTTELYACNLFYACSLFFMWMQVLHLLSVHRALGPLVIAFSRMRDDVIMFGTIWAVLLMAFSTAMHSAGENFAPRDETHEQVLPMQHWDMWWLVRTYFQSFGEPFYEELHTDASNVVMMVMSPVMNLMLVNLLVAIMNDTYSEVKEQSKLQWMVQMFYIAKEYRSPSRLNLAMLLIDVIDFVRCKADVNRRTKKLCTNTQTGIRGWFRNERFKFKRFLSRDLPAWERAEEEEDLLKQIARLEEKELGSSSKDVGIPGRVWMKQQVEWHADVSALASHQFLRKESAIKAGLRGCVAVPIDLGKKPTSRRATEQDATQTAYVCIFFAGKRINAKTVDRVVDTLRSAVSGKPDQLSFHFPHHLAQPPKAFIAGGDERIVPYLERVCGACDMLYAEASQPEEDGSMRVCAHVSRGQRQQRFQQESHALHFPQDPQQADLASSSSPLRSLTRSTLSRMSSDPSLAGSLGSEWGQDSSAEGAGGVWRWLFPQWEERARARLRAQRAEAKSKLKARLRKLRQKRKQDEEAVRSIQKLIVQAKTEYLRENDTSNLIRMPEGFRKAPTATGDGDI